MDNSIRVVDYLLNAATQSPHLWKVYSALATRYTDSTVNQPVVGVAWAAAWTSVGLAPDMHNKLEAARQLVILARLEELANRRLPDGAEQIPYYEGYREGYTNLALSKVNLEAGFCLLLREVDAHLVRETGRPRFVGTPPFFEENAAVAKWADLTRIQMAKDAAAAALDASSTSHNAVQEFLLHPDHVSNWAAIAFPGEEAQNRAAFQAKQEALRELHEIAQDFQKGYEAQRQEAIQARMRKPAASAEFVELAQAHLSENPWGRLNKETFEAQNSALVAQGKAAFRDRIRELTRELADASRPTSPTSYAAIQAADTAATRRPGFGAAATPRYGEVSRFRAR